MLYSNHILNDGVIRLTNIKKQTNEENLDDQKSKIATISTDMLFALEEIDSTLDKNNNAFRAKTILTENLKELKNASLNEAKEIIDRINYGTSLVDSNYSVYQLQYAMRNFNADYVLHDKSKVFNLIDWPERACNVLCPEIMPYARNTQTFTHAARANINVYGTSIYENYRAYFTGIKKVALGPLAGSRISNEAFDSLLLTPKPSFDYVTNPGTTYFHKEEKALLSDTIKYLRDGGILFYVIPYYRLYRDLCLLIAKNLTDVRVFQLQGSWETSLGLVLVCGKKASQKETNKEVYDLLRKSHDKTKLSPISEDMQKIYTLPKTETPITLFRGSVLDESQLEDVINASSATSEFWKSQAISEVYENTARPLLPFNIGQIGLVLTSGVLDGIIEEENNACHLIKGRVSKKTYFENIMNDGKLEQHQTMTNRVEINAFLPDGTFKVLT